MDQDQSKTIAELAGKYGLSFRTLRFYEERGLLSPRRQGLARVYSDRDETRLQLILKAKRLGFSISEIAQIIDRNQKLAEPDVSDPLRMAPDLIADRIDALTREKQALSNAIDELKGAFDRTGGAAGPNGQE